MADRPLFSIVIPTFNRAEFIGKSLKSVFDQTCQDFEVIVIDDGSTDQTGSVVVAFNDSRLKYYKTENRERAAARNYGVSQANGLFITFLDSDDLLKPDHIAEAKRFCADNQHAEIFSQGYDVVAADGSIKRWQRLPNPVNNKLLEGNYLSCLGVFAKREILLMNPFNEDRRLSGSEDYELWMRLAARFPIYTSPVSTASLVDHRSRSVKKINREQFSTRIALLKQYIGRDPEIQKSFGLQIPKLFAYTDLYAALHFAIDSFRKDAVKMLSQSFRLHPWVAFNYRFWVVIKKILIG